MRRLETTIIFGMVAAFIVFVGWQIQSTREASAQQETKAKSLGFADAADMQAARDHGISNVADWKVEQEKERRRIMEQNRVAAATAAKEAADRAARQAEIRELNRNPVDRMDLHNNSWSSGGFGTVGLMNLTISNQNDFSVKDITIQCRFYGKSGTEVSTALHTIYDAIKPKSKKAFHGVNVGFINSQSARGGCTLLTAKRS